MAKKILVAGLFHETHTFLKEKTGPEDFRRVSWYTGREIIAANTGNGSPMDGFLEVAALNGWEVIPSVQLAAMPSGLVEQRVVEAFYDAFLPVLRRHVLELDGIFLVLHGAMVSEETDDVEGELLQAIRTELDKGGRPSVPVVGILDLHANVSEKMTANSTCLYAYRENPHTDARASAVRAAHLLGGFLSDPQATQVFRSTPYILPPAGVGSADPPMKDLLAAARRYEQEDPELVCINVWAGYAYADIENCGFSLSCCTRGDAAGAASYLELLAGMLESRLSDAYPRDRDLAEVLAEVRQRPPGSGPVLLIEAADNIGGGTPGDGTGVLEPLLLAGERGIVAVINDPEAAEACRRAGLGAAVTLPAGARTDRHHGRPVTISGVVENLTDGIFDLENRDSHLASMMGTRISMGNCAVVKNDQLTLLLTSIKTPPMDLGQLHSQGISPEHAKYIIVKAAVSHRQAYDPLASAGYYIDGPGLCTSNLGRLPYRKALGKILSV